jgi:Fic family protein
MKADATAPGQLVPTITQQHAFVPATLPPHIDLNEIAVRMAEAMQAIGELKGACRRLPNPYILVRPLQRLEALTSSAMEGTFTTEDELALAEAGVGRDDVFRILVSDLDRFMAAFDLHRHADHFDHEGQREPPHWEGRHQAPATRQSSWSPR